MRTTVTSTEAAHLLGLDPRSMMRWARGHGVTPLRRQRIGRSMITVWSLDALTRAVLDSEPVAC